MLWRMSDRSINVAAMIEADAGRSEHSDDTSDRAPTMDSLVSTVPYARPSLAIIPRDESADDREASTTPALYGELTMMRGRALTFFRAVTPDGDLPSVIDLPTKLCTPYVRGKLYDLLCALEEEDANLRARSGRPLAVVTPLHLEA